MSPSFSYNQPTTFAIPEFGDNRTSNSKDTVNVTRVLTDAFETAFMSTGKELGYRIVERRVIQKVINELKETYSGNYLDQGLKEIGKLTNADALIIGEIKKFQPPQYKNSEKPDKVTTCTTIGFSIKAIDIETGDLLFKGNILKTAGRNPLVTGMDILSSCDTDLLLYSETVSSDLVGILIKEIKKNKLKK